MPLMPLFCLVAPAKADVQYPQWWIPAFAGKTVLAAVVTLLDGLVAPAKAGVQYLR